MNTLKLSEHKGCSICGGSYTQFGHNPQPVREDVNDRCCDDCNANIVMPVRMGRPVRVVMYDGTIFESKGRNL